MKQWSYLNSAKQILHTYGGRQPFAFHLKKYFSADKKFGSRDRKQISHLCYSYFRLGKMKMELAPEQRILLGWALCTANRDHLPEQIPDEWTKQAALLSEDHISFAEIFPWKGKLSAGVDHEEFCRSFLVQPDLFLRLRPGNEKIVLSKLENAGIDFQQLNSTCISLHNASKIEGIIDLNKEAVVQDYNSQATGQILENLKLKNLTASPAQASASKAGHQGPKPLATTPGQVNNLKPSVWDCCAASGGKSIMLFDLCPETDLTVSDIRASILINLKKRFREAGIEHFKSFTADITKPTFTVPHSSFDLIIADVPCTGSGTWSRTPEQLFYFEKKKINEYSTKQKKIVSTIIPALKTGGYFLYITCSVFKHENEDIADLLERQGLQLIKKELLKGYDKKADTLFAALLQKTL
jgi:16S rRNA (cytosine967-C5)-methyltransferase